MIPLILEYSSKAPLDTYLHNLKKDFVLVHTVSPLDGKIHLEQIKELIRKTHLLSSFSNKSLFLIENLDAALGAAQNALLKTLEELKEDQLIVITTKNSSSILATIRSRCQVIRLSQKEITSPTPPTYFDEWYTAPGKQLVLTDLIAKTDPKTYFRNCLDYLRFSHHDVHTTKALLQCLTDLDQNVNPKLAIDHFFFSISLPLKLSLPAFGGREGWGG